MSTVEFTIKAVDHASKVFEKVGHSATGTGTKMEKFQKVGKAAGVALGVGLLGAAKAAEEMTKKAAENQQSMVLLARQLHASTGATKEQSAAVEEWITKQGEATGVAKDDLRPALAKLAVATGSVTKAQKLAALAMDVSTGTGKSLTTVAFALAKAQNGNVSGLARLGVQTTKTTKDTTAYRKAQIASKSAAVAYTAAVKAHGKRSIEASIALGKLKIANGAVRTSMDATKKTTLSLGQITKNLSDQYGGAAAKNAQTAAGKQKILAFEMQELQVKIGTALIPVMLKLVDVGMKVIGWMDRNTKLAGVLIASLGGLLAVTFAVSAATKAWGAVTTIATVASKAWAASTALMGKAAIGTRIQLLGLALQEKAVAVGTLATAAAQKVAAVATKAWAATQWLLNAALTANPIGLIVVGIAALVAGLIIAYKKSTTFRNIVNGAFHAVAATAKTVFKAIAGVVVGAFTFIKAHWKLIAAILGGPIVAAVIVITSNWAKIKAGASAVFGFIKSVFGKMLAILVAPFKAYLAFMDGLLNKIKGAFSGAINLLTSVGGNIVQGLWNGVTAKWDAFTSWLSSKIASLPKIAKKILGIASPSKVFREIGHNVMDGLLGGIADRQIPLQTALSKVSDLISKVGDRISKLMSVRAGFKSTFSADSIFGQDFSQTTTDDAGNEVTTPGSIADVIAFQKAQADKARSLAADVKRATKMGLSKALVKQLESQGAAGAATLHALAQGTPAQIKQLNALNKQTSGSLKSAGMRAGNYTRGGSINDDIRLAHKQERVLELLEHHLKDLAHSEKKGQTINVVIDGEAIVTAIVRRNHRKGVKTAGL